MDRKFLHWLTGLRSKPMNRIMIFITHLGTGGIVWLLFSLLFFIQGQKTLSYRVLLALVVNGLICNLTLKPLLKRSRPSWIDKIDLLIKNPTDFSFPSGHASSSFAAATTIFFQNQGLGTFCLVLAGLIAFSRLYHFVHYPSDVVIGSLLGIAMAHLSRFIFNNYLLFLI